MTDPKLTPEHDRWEPETTRRQGRHALTSVEITVTNRCNMRCVHCAVGETLTLREPERIPERIAPYVDVMHISWNYTGVADFRRVDAQPGDGAPPGRLEPIHCRTGLPAA
ncbi:MAG: radical superfamily enzyme [Firmicutes bacterium]|nr:radical superfamily enzyme [Bacillota bacterium]